MHEASPPAADNDSAHAGRIRLAESTSGVGALVLGAGVGALLSARIGRAAIAIAVVGALLHAFGMWDKHRVQSRAEAGSRWWIKALYCICWLPLGGGAVVPAVGHA